MNETRRLPFRHRLAQSVRRNFLRKMVALGLAVLLYYYVHDQLGVERTLARVAVEIELPGDLYNGGAAAPLVAVTVRGGAEVADLATSDLRIVAAVSRDGFRPGMPYVLRLSPADVKTPSGIRAVRIEPQEILLEHLERILVERLPVAADWGVAIDRLPEAYTVTAEFVPDKVAVSGPESLVRGLREIRTAPLPLDPAHPESFTRPVALVAPGGVSVPTPTVEARIKVDERYMPRTFADVPLAVLDRPGESRRRAEFSGEDRVEVEIVGLPNQVLLMHSAQLRPYVDISGYAEDGEYAVDVVCRTPDDLECRVTRVFPGKVKVKIVTP